MSQENLKTLYDLAYKWGTDKAIGAPGYHGYSVVYENLFKNVQNNILNIEIHYSNKESSFPPYGKWGVAIIEKK